MDSLTATPLLSPLPPCWGPTALLSGKGWLCSPLRSEASSTARTRAQLPALREAGTDSAILSCSGAPLEACAPAAPRLRPHTPGGTALPSGPTGSAAGAGLRSAQLEQDLARSCGCPQLHQLRPSRGACAAPRPPLPDYAGWFHLQSWRALTARWVSSAAGRAGAPAASHSPHWALSRVGASRSSRVRPGGGCSPVWRTGADSRRKLGLSSLALLAGGFPSCGGAG